MVCKLYKVCYMLLMMKLCTNLQLLYIVHRCCNINEDCLISILN